MTETSLSAPAALLRQHDPDRYRFALFARPEHREAAFTLYAFNHEVAKTRDSVSETMIGAIRLQWWRESIEGIYGGNPRKHEVVTPLAALVEVYDLPKAPFMAHIDARERDLEDRPMQDTEEAERYARSTTESLVSLLADVVGADERDRSGLQDIAAGHALIGKIRASAHLEASRRPFFPRELLEAHGGKARDFAEMKADEGAKAAVSYLTGQAQDLITQGLGRTERRKALAPLLLPARQARQQASRLERAGYDPFHPTIAETDPLDIWRFWLARLTNRY